MSSGNSSSHRYHRQRQQHRLSSRSPSHQPTSGFESPLVHPALSRNPATAARGTSNIVDPNSAVDSLAGEFVNPAQAPRGSVRGARSFSSPSSSIGLTAGPASSPLPSVLYPGAASQSRGRLSAGDPRSPGYSSSSRPVAIGSEAYSTGNMTHETHSYGWQGRPSHPHLNPSFMGFDHSLSPSQSLPPDGLYTQQGSTRNYYQSGDLSAHYLSVPGGGLSQGSHHPRSASMSYEFPSSPVPANIPTMPDQSLMPPSPSYFLNQSDYYFAEGSSLSRHPSPIPPVRASSSSSRATPQPQPSLAPSMYYSSPDSTPASASTTAAEQERQVRVLGFRQKPQCWEHGCNGREFSTFSNLLRHQREKSGVVAKAECPVCGAAFTRTTARNIHVAQGKCKRESPG